MIDKLLLILWFLLRPKYYLHFFFKVKEKLLSNHDTIQNYRKAYDWAAANAIPYVDALKKLDLKGSAVGLDKDTIIKSKKLESQSLIKMGGAGHIHLIHDSVKLLKAEKVLETGVAYGWSSLAILKALSIINRGHLYSVDMPYPRKKNEKDVGIVVPNYLKKNWTLIREPDRPGIIKALKKIDGQLDLCHYDSDKSWSGRNYAFPILWKSLRSGGLFISDDIQDNLYFFEFINKKSLEFAVVKFEGKFVGLIRKP